ncbi:MAG: T9SS type A sorting domain-containing protein [Saprospiraceae bacterium]|nr:T9SS type A sorting domain-containing protein [Saprospiraceae bacterium]
MNRILHVSVLSLFLLPLLSAQNTNRSIDGSYNNPKYRDWGSVGSQLNIQVPLAYGDGISSPSGEDRPNPRMLSNALFSQSGDINDTRNLSAFNWGWGQFIDHDITLVKDVHDEVLPIAIPAFDPWFDPNGTGQMSISIKRSAFDPATGTSIDNPRVPVNAITAYIDGSGVYGSDEHRAKWLRTFVKGKLRTSVGNLLPYNTKNGEIDGGETYIAPAMDMPFSFINTYFVAGDPRANENPFLSSIHTLFVREHNRQCDELAAKHPDWNDEQLYQYARKMVSGIIQAIVYEEWLPTLGMQVTPYTGYKEDVNPQIMNVFSAAAFRYGHTTINKTLVRMNDDFEYIPEGNIELRDAFFNPSAINQQVGIESYFSGMSTVVQQHLDCKVIDDLRNFLFGPPGAGGLDLVSINLERGRDRGLPDFNSVRAAFGMSTYTSFEEITTDASMVQSMKEMYGDISKLDPWVGMLAEDHMTDAMFGPTAMYIIKQQFMDLRDGDRFYYENDPVLTAEEKDAIKATRLSEVIRRNTGLQHIPYEVFRVEQSTTSTQPDALADNRLELFPNPASSQIQVRIPETVQGPVVLTVTDLQGRQHLQQQVQQHDTVLRLDLPAQMGSGFYVINVRGKQYAAQAKFIKR